MFEKILFKKSSREQPTKRLIKLFCTALSTTGLLFCLSRGPAIINRITANNWEALFEVVLTAGRGQCQFSVSASRLTLNSCLLIRAVQQPAGIWERVAALSIAVVSASVSPLLVSCPFCGHGLQEPALVQRQNAAVAQVLCRVPSQASRAEFRRGTLKDEFVAAEAVILALFYFTCCAFCLLQHQAWTCPSLPLVQLFNACGIVSRPALHHEMVEVGEFVFFFFSFATERAGSLPENQIAWQEITKWLVSKSDFSLVNFSCLLKDKIHLEQL